MKNSRSTTSFPVIVLVLICVMLTGCTRQETTQDTVTQETTQETVTFEEAREEYRQDVINSFEKNSPHNVSTASSDDAVKLLDIYFTHPSFNRASNGHGDLVIRYLIAFDDSEVPALFQRYYTLSKELKSVLGPNELTEDNSDSLVNILLENADQVSPSGGRIDIYTEDELEDALNNSIKNAQVESIFYLDASSFESAIENTEPES